MYGFHLNTGLVSTKDDYLAEESPVIGLLSLIFFVFILLIQTIGMVMDRWGTFQHLISITQLWNPFQSKTLKRDFDRKENGMTTQEALEVCKMIFAEPIPEYRSYEDDEAEEKYKEEFKEQLKNIQTIGIRYTIGRSMNVGTSLRALTLRGSARFDLKAAGETANKLQHLHIGKSLKRILGNTYRETENDTALEEKGEFQKMRRTYQKMFRENEDPLQIQQGHSDICVVPSQVCGGESRAKLGQKFTRQITEFSRSMPIVGKMDPDDNIIDQIPGTMGRKLGRRLTLMHRMASEN
ncbi:hypothetical protein CHS0354_005273 [Potamilus streckersoni]|uniref:Uncharacterized protein n=1 Tax=Potamilus streckersoni TaxID=2493646 RepID=A0AAE0S3V1_9BIVA|nr:hypothetical protein CHS0354_005273 [Potamilus streckersoni]